MDNATIQEFLDEHDYDIRKTHNGRWIDQKCTMDVVCLVSDCIVEYTSGRNRKSFTVNDIWYNDYTVDNVQQMEYFEYRFGYNYNFSRNDKFGNFKKLFCFVFEFLWNRWKIL